ncbi:MAG: T9SS type A sorting domain-containing protein [Saprospiraceae bacterium]|nr:T9SS type A sorting domain-containing protein [Saprospiraceae bacterium]
MTVEPYLNGNVIYDLAIDGDYMWVSCANGIIKIDKQTYSIVELYNPGNSDFPEYDATRSIAIDDNGYIWAAVYGKGVAVLIDGKWILYDESNSPLKGNSVIGPSVQEVMIGSDGKVYIGSTNNGLYIKDGDNWINFNTDNSPLPDNYIGVIKEDSIGNIWIGTGQFYGSSGGLVKLSINNDWEVYTQEDSDLPANGIGDISIDNEQNIWLATKVGLSKFDGSTWTTWLQNSYVHAIDIDQSQNIYLSRQSGIKIFDRINQWQDIPSPSDTTYYNVYGILIDLDTSVWMISVATNGLFHYKSQIWNEVTPLVNGLEVTPVHALTKTLDNHYWIGTSFMGLIEFDGTNWTYYDLFKSSISNRRILELEEFKDGLILGMQWGSNSTVSSFDGTIETTILEGPRYIQDFYKLNDTIYIATSDALYRYDGDVDTLSDSNSGLPSNDIRGVNGYKDILWLTTSKGLVKCQNEIWQGWDTMNSNIPNNNTKLLDVDINGNPWFITEDSSANPLLIKFDGVNFLDFTDTFFMSIGPGFFRDLEVIDDQHIYIGHSKGVCIKTDGVWKLYKAVNINDIYRDGQKVFFAFQSGLLILDLDCTSGMTDFDEPLQTPFNSGICVYPNPASNELNIDFQPGIRKDKSLLTVYDLVGRIMHQIPNPGQTMLQTSTYPDGVYLIDYDDGRNHYIQKFLIQH